MLLVLQESNFFKSLDSDGDGLLSFQEYMLVITLLSIPEQVRQQSTPDIVPAATSAGQQHMNSGPNWSLQLWHYDNCADNAPARSQTMTCRQRLAQHMLKM